MIKPRLDHQEEGRDGGACSQNQEQGQDAKDQWQL